MKQENEFASFLDEKFWKVRLSAVGSIDSAEASSRSLLLSILVFFFNGLRMVSVARISDNWGIGGRYRKDIDYGRCSACHSARAASRVPMGSDTHGPYAVTYSRPTGPTNNILLRSTLIPLDRIILRESFKNPRQYRIYNYHNLIAN